MISFANPLGALAFLALPAILALHLLRRRRRERRVAGLFLFAEEIRATPAGRRIEPLRRSASLILELVAATLLALLLCQPRIGSLGRLDHLVVVLDDSASMGAVVDGESIAERARSEVRSRLRSLQSDGLASIVLTGSRPHLLAGPRVPAGDVAEALSGYAPTAAAHDIQPALAMALELVGARGEVVFVTDRDPGDLPARIALEAVGSAAPNAAVVTAMREGRGPTETIRLAIRSYADTVLDTTVRLVATDGKERREVAARPLRLDPDRLSELSVEVPRSTLALEVSLGSDALAADSTVTMLPEPSRVVSIASTLDEKSAKRLGLSRLLGILPDVRAEPDAARASLVLASEEGTPPPGGVRLVISAPGTERDDWLGPFLRERRDPLLEGMSLEGVLWSAGRGLDLGRPLISASGQALLTREETPEGTILRLNVDLARSTVTASADGPIFLANLVEEVRRQLPGVVQPNVALGDTLAYRHALEPAIAATARLIRPSGQTLPLHGRPRAEWDAEEPGIHRLEGVPGESPAWSVAFIDSIESDLRAARRLSRPAPEGEGTKEDDGRSASSASLRQATSPATRILLLALLLVAAAAWWVGSRTAVGTRT